MSDIPVFEDILYEKRERAAWIIINRPKLYNAFRATTMEELIKEARSMGYKRLLLDTLPIMDKAHKLYRSLEFREIPSYQKNPVPGALFFELNLL